MVGSCFLTVGGVGSAMPRSRARPRALCTRCLFNWPLFPPTPPTVTSLPGLRDTVSQASHGISHRPCAAPRGSAHSKTVVSLTSLLKAKTPEIKPSPLQYHKPPKCHHADGILTKMSRITKNSFLSSHVLRGDEQGSICIVSATVVARTNPSCWGNSQPLALSRGSRHSFNF